MKRDAFEYTFINVRANDCRPNRGKLLLFLVQSLSIWTGFWFMLLLLLLLLVVLVFRPLFLLLLHSVFPIKTTGKCRNNKPTNRKPTPAKISTRPSTRWPKTIATIEWFSNKIFRDFPQVYRRRGAGSNGCTTPVGGIAYIVSSQRFPTAMEKLCNTNKHMHKYLQNKYYFFEFIFHYIVIDLRISINDFVGFLIINSIIIIITIAVVIIVVVVIRGLILLFINHFYIRKVFWFLLLSWIFQEILLEFLRRPLFLIQGSLLYDLIVIYLSK